MEESCQDLRFVLKAAQHTFRGNTRVKDLEGNDAPGILLLGFVDGSHSARSDHALDRVLGDAPSRSTCLLESGAALDSGPLCWLQEPA